MDAQAILTKIGEDAEIAAMKVEAEAKEKAKMLTLEAQQNREQMNTTMLAQAEQECALMEERMNRMAELDNRKAMLAQKRQVIDEAFCDGEQEAQRNQASRPPRVLPAPNRAIRRRGRNPCDRR